MVGDMDGCVLGVIGLNVVIQFCYVFDEFCGWIIVEVIFYKVGYLDFIDYLLDKMIDEVIFVVLMVGVWGVLLCDVV